MVDTIQLLLVGHDGWLTASAEAFRTRYQGTVETVRTGPAALESVRRGQVDCVVTQYELEEMTGVELLRELRAETTALPVILATTAGSEAVASEAIAAGITAYLPVDGTEADVTDVLIERTERAVTSARRDATDRERARQFDAIFDDDRTATWVLDPDGSLARVNQTGREMADDAEDTGIGDPFWTLPLWADASEIRRDIRRLVEQAIDGTFGNAVINQSSRTDSHRALDLSVRPVENDQGDLGSIVVEGVDITDRVSLERDLRLSEELHRVTLNNMTDTVLITDGDGEYTYVCPNVHFIFGYTAEEIHAQGTIANLLGEDLFDRGELAQQGVLKNLECTVTDKGGHEHTLLVNVREVSIQGGTLLYSCRDVTKRKQREEALATLQETTRDFLYAETHQEIAQHVVDDTPAVLNFEASAVYLFDGTENELRPAAYSGDMEALNGPLPSVRADGETLPSYSFVEDEALFFDDVHDAERLQNHATELRSAAYIPLGNHGVFVVGSEEVGTFATVSRELADLLAATAEAAFDRVTRESRLREQDRTLQRQNDQLSTLNNVNETIRAIDQALVRAETPVAVDHAVCELLTEDDRFRFAWIGTVDPTAETVEPRAWAGPEESYLDSCSFSLGPSAAEPATRTAKSGEVTMVDNVAARLHDESWRKAALSRDFLSVLSIPLVYNDLRHGILTVYAATPETFDEMSQTVLGELGETIASALSSLERKNALLTTSMTQVEFDVDDSSFILSRLAEDAGCTLSYRGGVQQTSDGNYLFVTVEDAPLADVEDVARDLVAVEEVRQISTGDSGGVLRLALSHPFLALELADHGAILRAVSANQATTMLRIDVPDSIDLRHVTQILGETFAEVDLRSKHSLDTGPDHGVQSEFLEDLTDRQLEVLQTAYYSGFFESPRENTGEDVAETLGISPPAFYQHARTVQRKLFSSVFDGSGNSTAGFGDGLNN